MPDSRRKNANKGKRKPLLVKHFVRHNPNDDRDDEILEDASASEGREKDSELMILFTSLLMTTAAVCIV